MNYTDLPTLNTVLNGFSAIMLLFGFIYIKRGEPSVHMKFMIAAIISSGLFLLSYLIYHYRVGSVPYPYHDWTRPVYFAILVPHVILAAVMVPFILLAIYYAWRKRYEKHKRITRRLWPVWIFVSLSGIAVYLMLYRF